MSILRNKLSAIACIICFVGLITVTTLTARYHGINNYRVITWDALGYYLYLPSAFIYDDIKQLKWYDEIDRTYKPTGSYYQFDKYKNGNYVMRYTIGTAIMELPFFLVADYVAPKLSYPRDGFSQPYQWSIVFACLFYSFLGIWVLRNVLLNYFSDLVVGVTMILVVLATNYPIYSAVDSGMTHGFLFSLYCFQLWFTVKWYSNPKWYWAFGIGLFTGLATVIRPTDAVMLLVPLFWSEFNKESTKSKWAFVKQHYKHAYLAIAGGVIGVLPQLAYWKYVTGSWVYEMGSKWVFLNPWWRVLIGWEKGWFIYTPITLFFVMGLFLMRGKPFKKAVAIFFLLNTWIIISWFEWKYGGSYSCRALVQSYPVLALSFASSVQWCLNSKWKVFWGATWIYLLLVNVFQLYQYNTQIIHYNDMNRKAYQAVYLNFHPTAVDMSMLDADDRIKDERSFRTIQTYGLSDSTFNVDGGSSKQIFDINIDSLGEIRGQEFWAKVSLAGITYSGLWKSKLVTELPDTICGATSVRMDNSLNKEGSVTKVEFYKRIPANCAKGHLLLSLQSEYPHKTAVKSLQVCFMVKK